MLLFGAVMEAVKVLDFMEKITHVLALPLDNDTMLDFDRLGAARISLDILHLKGQLFFHWGITPLGNNSERDGWKKGRQTSGLGFMDNPPWITRAELYMAPCPSWQRHQRNGMPRVIILLVGTQ